MEKETHTGAGFLAGLVTPWGIHGGAVLEEFWWDTALDHKKSVTRK